MFETIKSLVDKKNLNKNKIYDLQDELYDIEEKLSSLVPKYFIEAELLRRLPWIASLPDRYGGYEFALKYKGPLVSELIPFNGSFEMNKPFGKQVKLWILNDGSKAPPEINLIFSYEPIESILTFLSKYNCNFKFDEKSLHTTLECSCVYRNDLVQALKNFNNGKSK